VFKDLGIIDLTQARAPTLPVCGFWQVRATWGRLSMIKSGAD
jgi:hypothetical protein